MSLHASLGFRAYDSRLNGSDFEICGSGPKHLLLLLLVEVTPTKERP